MRGPREHAGSTRPWGALVVTAVVSAVVAAAFLTAPRAEPQLRRDPRVGLLAAGRALRIQDEARARAAFAALLRREPCSVSGAWKGAGPELDEGRFPDAVFLRDHPLDEADNVLLTWLMDPRRSSDARVRAAVAMLRPEHFAARDDALLVILDPSEDEDVRRVALERLPLVGGRVPLELRSILHAPWHELDRLAAVVLAAGGDAEAPSLVRSALSRAARTGYGSGWWAWKRAVLAEAVLRSAQGDAAVGEVVRALRTASPDAPEGDGWQQLLDAFDRWLAAHPEAHATAFEQSVAPDGRAAARREAWLGRTADEIAALPDEEIDVAAAVCALTLPKGRRWRHSIASPPGCAPRWRRRRRRARKSM